MTTCPFLPLEACVASLASTQSSLILTALAWNEPQETELLQRWTVCPSVSATLWEGILIDGPMLCVSIFSSVTVTCQPVMASCFILGNWGWFSSETESLFFPLHHVLVARGWPWRQQAWVQVLASLIVEGPFASSFLSLCVFIWRWE